MIGGAVQYDQFTVKAVERSQAEIALVFQVFQGHFPVIKACQQSIYGGVLEKGITGTGY